MVKSVELKSMITMSTTAGRSCSETSFWFLIFTTCGSFPFHLSHSILLIELSGTGAFKITICFEILLWNYVSTFWFDIISMIMIYANHALSTLSSLIAQCHKNLSKSFHFSKLLHRSVSPLSIWIHLLFSYLLINFWANSELVKATLERFRVIDSRLLFLLLKLPAASFAACILKAVNIAQSSPST